jgi:hypothetical protein
MDLMMITGELMPAGKPQFLQVIKYPMINQIIQIEGKRKMLAVLVLMVKDFCSSLNVVRNMNEDQMIETASMLLDECGNFRLEDYLMMFSMAKRGDLVKIMDRVDIQLVSNILDEYWLRRKRAAKKHEETEVDRIDSMGPTAKAIEDIHPVDAKMIRATENLAIAFEALRNGMTDHGLDTLAQNETKE